MGISAFVVDWYGDREPFIDRELCADADHGGQSRTSTSP